MKLNNNIVIFDGVCNLCDGFVRLLIKLDKKKKFYYTHNQSQIARHIFQVFGLREVPDSIFFYHDQKIYQKSQAVFEIIKLLPWPLHCLLIFKVFPRKINDNLYQRLADNRYRLFGKKDYCHMPTNSEPKRFLD